MRARYTEHLGGHPTAGTGYSWSGPGRPIANPGT